MENCLVTKLKASVNADISKLGELVLNITPLTNAYYYLKVKATKIVTITADGEGYFATSIANLVNDPLTIKNDSTGPVVYLSNQGTYKIHISDKYAVTDILLYVVNSSGSAINTAPHANALNISDLKYLPLTVLRGNGTLFGYLSDLAGKNCDCYIQYNEFDEPELIHLASVTTCQINNTNIEGKIEDYVNARAESTMEKMSFVSNNNQVSFGYETPEYLSIKGIGWESKTKIYAMNGNNMAQSNYIWCKGYSASEIQTNMVSGGVWNGKTVYDVSTNPVTVYSGS